MGIERTSNMPVQTVWKKHFFMIFLLIHVTNNQNIDMKILDTIFTFNNQNFIVGRTDSYDTSNFDF